MLSRAGWLLAALAAAGVALLGPEAIDATGDLRGSSFPAALLALGSLVHLALSSWVLLAVGLSLAHAPAPLVRAVAPRVLRRALFAGAAGALALTPVHADQSVAPRSQHDVTGLRLPDRPIASAPHSEPTGQTAVVVRPGDTLWAIAARSLPAGASAAEIGRACAEWHAANRNVIGADPNLIFPTQRLTPPLGKDPT